jgi:hypothetical protein
MAAEWILLISLAAGQENGGVDHIVINGFTTEQACDAAKAKVGPLNSNGHSPFVGAVCIERK